MSKLTAWHDLDGVYKPMSDTVPRLPAGMYSYGTSSAGFFFASLQVVDREIVRFPDTVVDGVVDEIQRFWELGAHFKKHGFPHKRGILMHGPPGSGKTCTLQLIIQDVVARDGVVFPYMNGFETAYRVLREIEPERPLVVTLEDLDSIAPRGKQGESDLLNILDGIGDMTRVVFVATTNYPENLDPRITNRPSRFDRRVEVPYPSPAARTVYLESLIRKGDKVDLEGWVRDTKDFSFAHLKELFVSVIILRNEYEGALKTLKAMQQGVSSLDGVRTGVYA